MKEKCEHHNHSSCKKEWCDKVKYNLKDSPHQLLCQPCDLDSTHPLQSSNNHPSNIISPTNTPPSVPNINTVYYDPLSLSTKLKAFEEADALNAGKYMEISSKTFGLPLDRKSNTKEYKKSVMRLQDNYYLCKTPRVKLYKQLIEV